MFISSYYETVIDDATHGQKRIRTCVARYKDFFAYGKTFAEAIANILQSMKNYA